MTERIVCPKCRLPIPPSQRPSAGTLRCRCGTIIDVNKTLSRAPVPHLPVAERGTAPTVIRPKTGFEPAPPAKTHPHTGELLAPTQSYKRYATDEEIARGGMGAILRARDCDIRREVAMKVMINDDSEQNRLRFIEEAQVTGQLEHPNIVPIHELGIDREGRLFFTMKLVNGRSLASVLQAEAETKRARPEFSLMQHLRVLVNVCNAVEFAHSRGVIHRDLKPENVMLGDFGEVLVMDWGLAKTGVHPNVEFTGAENRGAGTASASHAVRSARQGSTQGLTVAGAVVGTPAYMSPEQACSDHSAVDHRSDIYSLGGILYKILTLTPPIRGGDVFTLLEKAAEGKVEAPEIRAPHRRIPKELSAITRKAMAASPEQRYQTVAELRQDLDLFLEGRAVSAKQDTLFETLQKWTRRNTGVFATASAAVVLLLAGGAYGIMQVVHERNIAREELSKREQLESEKTERRRMIEKDAAQAVAAGVRALDAGAKTDNAAAKETALIQAQTHFRRALFLMDSAAASAGMRDASLQHYELALQNRNWRQAWEKIEQLRQVGLEQKKIDALALQLKNAESARTAHIRKRIDAIMDDARGARAILYDHAVAELISLKDPATVDILLQCLNDSHEYCRQLAVAGLAWMGEERVIATLLPLIQKTLPDGKPNPFVVQREAVRALMVLAPDDLRVLETLRQRLFANAGDNDRELQASVDAEFKRYAARLSPQLARNDPAGNDYLRRLNDGLTHLDANQLQPALDAFDAALRLKSDSAAAYCNRGETRRRLGDFKGALADCSQAIQLKPDMAEAFVNRSTLRRQIGDVPGALADAEKAVALNPGFVECHLVRALANHALKNRDRALDDFNSAIKLNPRHPLAYFYRGSFKLEAGDREGAIADFSAGIEHNPKHAALYGSRGMAYHQNGAFDKALADFNRALELDPRDFVALANRAEVRKDKREVDGALADITRVLEISADRPEFWRLKAMLCFATGDDTAFRKALAAGKALHPKPAEFEADVLREAEELKQAVQQKQK